jgi:hypothetical protein
MKMRSAENNEKSLYNSCLEWGGWVIQQAWDNRNVISAVGVIAFAGIRGFSLVQVVSDAEAENQDEQNNRLSPR